MKNIMKKKSAIVSIIVACIMSTCVTFASTDLSYKEWYYQKFGEYPMGGVSDWRYDPVYSEYLREIGETGYNNNVDGDPIPPVPPDPYDQRYYPRIQDVWWNGRTARWDVDGFATKYQVTLYRDGNRVTTKTTTSRSFSFSSYMSRGDNDYYFEVRAYNKHTDYWSNWETSDSQYVSHTDVYPDITPDPGPGVIVVPGTNPPVNNNTAIGQWFMINNMWYFKYNNGQFASNTWLNLNGKWYFFNVNCTMATGWLNYNGKQYFLNPDGSMVTGTVIFDGITHFFGNDGAMVY